MKNLEEKIKEEKEFSTNKYLDKNNTKTKIENKKKEGKKQKCSTNKNLLAPIAQKTHSWKEKKQTRNKIKPYLTTIGIPILMSISYGIGKLEEKIKQEKNINNKEYNTKEDKEQTKINEEIRTKTIEIATIKEKNEEKIQKIAYDTLKQKYSTNKSLLAPITQKIHPKKETEKKYDKLEKKIKQENKRIRTITPPLAIDSINIKKGEYFIEINKPEQRLRIWKKTNYKLIADVAISTGIRKEEKKRQGDNATPKGYTRIKSRENSSKWLYKGKQAYGPYFFRLDYGSWDKKGKYNPKGHCSIGIHGTNEEEYLGKERSHGCIRVKNEFLIEAKNKQYLKEGTRIYIVPYNKQKKKEKNIK